MWRFADLCGNQVPISIKRGVNKSADRRIWPQKAHGLWISVINRADSRIWKIPWIAGQLKVLAWFPDSVSLEVRIVSVINFRSALINVLLFCRLVVFCRRIFMYSSIDSVTEMTSGNLVHGFCMVPHGSGKGPIVGGQFWKCTKCEGGQNFKTQDWHYML